MPRQPFHKRRVPWHAPFPILKRRQHLTRLKRKGLLPSPASKAAPPADPELIEWAKRQRGG